MPGRAGPPAGAREITIGQRAGALPGGLPAAQKVRPCLSTATARTQSAACAPASCCLLRRPGRCQGNACMLVLTEAWPGAGRGRRGRWRQGRRAAAPAPAGRARAGRARLLRAGGRCAAAGAGRGGPGCVAAPAGGGPGGVRGRSRGGGAASGAARAPSRLPASYRAHHVPCPAQALHQCAPRTGDPQEPVLDRRPEPALRPGGAGGVVHVWRGAAAHRSEREGVDGLRRAHDALAALLSTLGLPPGTLICLASQARGRPGAGLRPVVGVFPGACMAGVARRALGAALVALRARGRAGCPAPPTRMRAALPAPKRGCTGRHACVRRSLQAPRDAPVDCPLACQGGRPAAHESRGPHARPQQPSARGRAASRRPSSATLPAGRRRRPPPAAAPGPPAAARRWPRAGPPRCCSGRGRLRKRAPRRGCPLSLRRQQAGVTLPPRRPPRRTAQGPPGCRRQARPRRRRAARQPRARRCRAPPAAQPCRR